MASRVQTDEDLTLLPHGDWHVSDSDSELGFETKMLGLIPVHGRYGGLEGELHVDAEGRASGGLRVDAASVRTGIGKRDSHLRSGDFFAVEEHPQLRFQLDSLAPGAGGSLQLAGTLHVRGHELPIAAPVQVSREASGRLRIDAEIPVAHRGSSLHSTGSGWKKVPAGLKVKGALVLEPDSAL